MKEKQKQPHLGGKVQIVDNKHRGLIGSTGQLERFSKDGTTALVKLKIGSVWCSVYDLTAAEDEKAPSEAVS